MHWDLWTHSKKESGKENFVLFLISIITIAAYLAISGCGDGERSAPVVSQPHLEKENDLTSPELQGWLDQRTPRAKPADVMVSAHLEPSPQSFDFSGVGTWYGESFISALNPSLPLEGGLKFVANPEGSAKVIEIAYSPKTSNSTSWCPAEGLDIKKQTVGGPLYIQVCDSGLARVQVFSLNDILIDTIEFHVGESSDEADQAIQAGTGDAPIRHCNVLYNAKSSSIFRIHLDSDVHFPGATRHWQEIHEEGGSYSSSIGGIALDLAAGKMYWTQFYETTKAQVLYRANLDGSGKETVVPLLPPHDDPDVVGLWLSGDYLYLAQKMNSDADENDSNSGPVWGILRVHKEGTGSVETLIDNIPSLRRMVLDERTQTFYYAHYTAQRAEAAGGENEDDEEGDAVVEGLQADGSYVTQGGILYRAYVARVAIDGTNTETLGEYQWHDFLRALGFAVDTQEGKVYVMSTARFTDPQTGATLSAETDVERMNYDGSGREVVVSDLEHTSDWMQPFFSGNYLMLDHANRKIYFVDDAYLHSADWDGGNVQRVNSDVISHSGSALAITFCGN